MYEVAPVEPTCEPPRYTPYPSTPLSSLDGFQAMLTEVSLTVETARAGGAEGAVVSGQPAVESRTLEAADIPVDPSQEAISTTALTSLPEAAGLHVRTQHVTRLPASAYAAALLTVGLVDGVVLIAAPSGSPVTGETALVGLL